MALALEEARAAADRGEVPVGAVVVQGAQVLARAGNRTRELADPTAHAEMLAIRIACQEIGSERLIDCDLYVTLEPCPMCAGALVGARVSRIVFGAYNDETGCATSLINLADLPGARTSVTVLGGVLETQCVRQLKSFFQIRRGGRARLNALDSKSSRG